MSRTRAHCYIDGFNLYYGALKGHGDRKWLDIRAWCERLLSGQSVERVVYCTARVEGRDGDAAIHQRQDSYLRALQASGVEVIEGNFSTRMTAMMRAPGQTCETCDLSTGECPRCGNRKIRVLKTEEKGSDVNLAVELVRDVFVTEMSTALVVSGDSDLQRAIDIARAQGTHVVTVEPRNRVHAALIGDDRRRVRSQALLECQLPDEVTLPSGIAVRRPAPWS